jgi:AraC-like DNA-binding protein
MIARPDHLTVRPNLGGKMDALAEVLGSVRLIGGVFLSAHFTAPWCIGVRLHNQDCIPFLGRPAQMVAYHVVTEGEMIVSFDDDSSIDVSAGEIVLFPQNEPHVLCNELGLEPVSARQLIQPPRDGGLAQIVHGGNGHPTRVFCGFLAGEETYNPLFATLPKALKIDVRGGATRDWIEASVRFAAAELAEGRLASSSVMTRLSESLLTEAVRHYSASPVADNLGWLKGLKDQQVGRALALIHHRLNADWSADTLAREVALSRSAFVERFRSLVGMPPIRYLTVWRLQTPKQT